LLQEDGDEEDINIENDFKGLYKEGVGLKMKLYAKRSMPEILTMIIT
jgi:hypothetical protein